MNERLSEKLRRQALYDHRVDLQTLPRALCPNDGRRVVRAYVEGYEDVAFWRGIFDHFRSECVRFEISVPTRRDLPKGKKVLLSMADRASEQMLLCMDSDFDYLLSELTPQSRLINSNPFMFHTYAYATENYLCYAPALHNICVKATKNDTRIFSFEDFMREYSLAIYPLFLWYVYSASRSTESVLTLIDFKASVRLGYVELANNGADTIAWLKRHVGQRERSLRSQHPEMVDDVCRFGDYLQGKGVEPAQTYLYMHGHTLMDNVVMIALNSVCEKLRQMSVAKIVASSKEGVALKNEMSNYNNSLRPIRDVLLDNENYIDCPLYRSLSADIEEFLARVERDAAK